MKLSKVINITARNTNPKYPTAAQIKIWGERALELEAENERLRDALRAIAFHYPKDTPQPTMRDIALEALAEGKE